MNGQHNPLCFSPNRELKKHQIQHHSLSLLLKDKDQIFQAYQSCQNIDLTKYHLRIIGWEKLSKHHNAAVGMEDSPKLFKAKLTNFYIIKSKNLTFLFNERNIIHDFFLIFTKRFFYFHSDIFFQYNVVSVL